MQANVRLWIQDTNTTTAPAFTAPQITTFINTALLWWYENNEKRVKYVTLVADWDAAIADKDGDATCLYPEIMGVYLSTSGIDIPLDPISWGEMRFRQIDTTPGTPTHYAKLKYGSAAVSAAAQNKWKFALFPIPDTANNVLKGTVRDYPVQLSADADIVDLGDMEAKCVEIIAAIFAAPRMGRQDLAQDLMGLLPQMIQDKLATHETHAEVNA